MTYLYTPVRLGLGLRVLQRWLRGFRRGICQLEQTGNQAAVAGK